MTATDASAGRTQRRLQALYDRRGSHFVVRACFYGTWTLTALTGTLMMVWIARYLRLSFGQAALGYALMAPTIGVGAWIASYRWRDKLRALLRWPRLGSDHASAADVWDAAVRGVPRGIAEAYIGGLIGSVAAAAAMVAVWHEPAYTALPLWAALATGGGAALVICVFSAELLLRPMVQDIARQLPREYVVGRPDVRLRTKALAPLPVVALYAALTVGAFVNVRASGSVRLLIAIGIALVTIVVATIVFLVVTRSALAPLDELLEATERVRGGDLDTQVPILTSDDFGQLSTSFNRMLEGLRERESLRDQNVELASALQASLARVVAAGDAERRRFERNLHEGPQQRLVLVNLRLAMLDETLRSDPAKASRLVQDVRADLQSALAEMRDLARGIYPPLLESEGLSGALREVAGRAALPAELDCDGITRYPPELEAAVYFCCKEALQNAGKYAGEGARATVTLSQRDHELRFEISDTGCGFDPSAVTPHSGLQNMTDRIGAIGGRLSVRSAPGDGTSVAGAIPVG